MLVLGLAAAQQAAPLQTLPANDCALPTNSNYDLKLAEDADIVVTGLAMSSLEPGAAVCAAQGAAAPGSGSIGPDLLIRQGAQEDGSQVSSS